MGLFGSELFVWGCPFVSDPCARTFWTAFCTADAMIRVVVVVLFARPDKQRV